ncbi:parapinopsin-like [Plodia interpunctella]|uniref:parapinopsin-like n=1 Tax=Plodia interpunctella TaxID=58824 RepID=UPI002367CBC5|nr:parapinopsin-like [Plodia interpunctella]XP_053608833.1 parapinopsin-like [Plodia interpunctella]
MTTYSELNDTVIRAYDEGFPLLMPKWGYVVSAFVLFLIGFFGFFLNLMVILLMFKDRQLWTPLNVILFNLVCSDFSVSVLGNPFTLVSALFHRWVFGHTMCVLYGFFMALLGITSITTLTVISFERYMLVTRPLSSRHLSSKGAALSIGFIWTYSLALTTPPLIGWGNYDQEAANISCSVNWHEQSMNTLTYILFLFAMGLIVPLAVIIYSYVNIIRTLKKNSQRLGRVSRAETKATAMVFVMIIAFMVAWTPYSVFALMEQFASEGIISPGAGVIPALVAKSSICYDPLIYVGMNTQFRQSIKPIFGIHTKNKQSQLKRGYNNTVLSPARLNDATTRFNSTETIVSTSTSKKFNKDRKLLFNDEVSDLATHDNKMFQRDLELCTIQENRTASDTERSIDTFDEESKHKMGIFGASCKLFRKRSPIVTIIDTEHLIFSQIKKTRNDEKEIDDGYGNDAYEDHISDRSNNDVFSTENEYQRVKSQKIIKRSYSLDLSVIANENKKRKLSIETKLESVVRPKGIFNETIDILFDQDSHQFHNYLYNIDKNETTDDEV